MLHLFIHDQLVWFTSSHSPSLICLAFSFPGCCSRILDTVDGLSRPVVGNLKPSLTSSCTKPKNNMEKPCSQNTFITLFSLHKFLQKINQIHVKLILRALKIFSSRMFFFLHICCTVLADCKHSFKVGSRNTVTKLCFQHMYTFGIHTLKLFKAWHTPSFYLLMLCLP